MKRGIRPKGKWRLSLLFVLLVFLPFDLIIVDTSDVAAGQHQAGESDEEKDLTLDQIEGDIRDPEILFYLGSTEENGDSSRKYLGEITRHFPDWANADAAQLLVCKYEFCKGMYLTTVDLAKRVGQDHPSGQTYPEALWISGCCLLATDQPDSALLRFDTIVKSFPDSRWVQWAQLGRGDCFLAAHNFDQAAREYHRILDGHKDSEAFAFAISGLARCFHELENQDKALLYHNLLKEKYPSSLELSGDLAQIIEFTDEARDKTRAEGVAGVKYTIQLGVFAEQEEASRLASDFEKQGYSTAVGGKTIGGKRYFVVWLGSFSSYDQALEIKKRLQSQTGQSYRIVIR